MTFDRGVSTRGDLTAAPPRLYGDQLEKFSEHSRLSAGGQIARERRYIMGGKKFEPGLESLKAKATFLLWVPATLANTWNTRIRVPPLGTSSVHLEVYANFLLSPTRNATVSNFQAMLQLS